MDINIKKSPFFIITWKSKYNLSDNTEKDLVHNIIV